MPSVVERTFHEPVKDSVQCLEVTREQCTDSVEIPRLNGGHLRLEFQQLPMIYRCAEDTGPSNPRTIGVDGRINQCARQFSLHSDGSRSVLVTGCDVRGRRVDALFTGSPVHIEADSRYFSRADDLENLSELAQIRRDRDGARVNRDFSGARTPHSQSHHVSAIWPELCYEGTRTPGLG